MQVLNQKYNTSYNALRAAKEALYLEAQQMEVQDSVTASRLRDTSFSPSSLTQRQAVPPLLLAAPLFAPAPAPAQQCNWITELLKTPRSQAEAATQDYHQGMSA